MKEFLEALLSKSVKDLQRSTLIPDDIKPSIDVVRTRNPDHGDYSTNLALALAPVIGMTPQALAEALVMRLPLSDRLERVDITARGFINFRIASSEIQSVVPLINQMGHSFGRSTKGDGSVVLVDSVIAVGTNQPNLLRHQRIKANANAIANILEAVGYRVVRGPWLQDSRRLNAIKSSIVEKFRKSEHVYQENGAIWVNSAKFGDEKDRILINDVGDWTGCAYALGALLHDHQGESKRFLFQLDTDNDINADTLVPVGEALGLDCTQVELLGIQDAQIRPGTVRELISADDLQDLVGSDALQYFCVMRRRQQPLDFSPDLATRQALDNPVFNVQYAHARICSIERQARDKGWTLNRATGHEALDLLDQSQETGLMTLLASYPECVEVAALERAPNQITIYLQELANGLNKYYDAHKWLIEDERLRHSRMCLILAARQVLKNGLGLLDVSAPEVL